MKNILKNDSFKFLLTLIALIIFYISSQSCLETPALLQGAEGLQIEQSIVCQSKLQRAAAVSQAKTITPLQAVRLLFLPPKISNLAAKTAIAEVLFPAIGQRILSFLMKSHTFHKASEDPHLFT